MAGNTLRDSLVDEIKDIYNANEITSYGTMIAWAEALELTEVASLLNEARA